MSCEAWCMDVHIALLMSDSGSDSGSNRQPEAVYDNRDYFASARPASDSRFPILSRRNIVR